MNDERTDPAAWERAEEETDRRWVRILDRNLPDPAVTREHRAWWRTFLARLDDYGFPPRKRPAARRQLARALRWTRWPMAESWEAVVRDPGVAEYVAWVYSILTIQSKYARLDVRAGRITPVRVPSLLRWYRRYERIMKLAGEMPSKDPIIVLWWARWPEERRPSAGEERSPRAPGFPAGGSKGGA